MGIIVYSDYHKRKYQSRSSVSAGYVSLGQKYVSSIPLFELGTATLFFLIYSLRVSRCHDSSSSYLAYDEVICTTFVDKAMSLTQRCINVEFLVSDSLYTSAMTVKYGLDKLPWAGTDTSDQLTTLSLFTARHIWPVIEHCSLPSEGSTPNSTTVSTPMHALLS